MKDGRKIVLKYVITSIIAAGVSVLLLYLNGIGEAKAMYVRYMLLSDAFTTPGIVMVMMGCLVWVSTFGIFDGLGYAFKRAGAMFIPFNPATYRHETFYDYKTKKQEKRAEGHSYAFLFFVGLAFLLIGVVFLILYFTVKV